MTQKKNGRPRVYSVTSKQCKGCGSIFSMEDVGVKFPSHFRYFSYCGAECRNEHADYYRENFGSPRTDDEMREHLKANSTPMPNGCIEWTGRKSRKGYGQTWRHGKQARAHRVAYELAKGPIPDGLMILHSCDNPPCINPEHLRAGTARENVRDAISRGRWTQARAAGRHVIASPEKVAEIARSHKSLKDLAKENGISATTAWRIRHGLHPLNDSEQKSTKGDGVSAE